MSTVIEKSATALPVRRPVAALVGAALGGAALQLTPVGAAAQKVQMDLSLETQATASSNPSQLAGNGHQADLILDLRPRMRVRSVGSGLRLDINAGAIARKYTQGTSGDRLEPDVDARVGAEVIDGWVTLDGSVRVFAGTTDPFVGRGQSSADITPGSYRQQRATLSPRLRRDLGPDWQLRAHSENAWQRSEDPNGSLGVRELTHTTENAVRLERRAMPVGVSLDVRSQRQKNSASVQDGTVLAIDATRLGASYRAAPTLIAGVTAGTERSTYLSRDDRDSLVGVNVDWQPNERTWLRGSTEKRFFGQAFDVALGYRSPFLAVNATWTKQPGLSANTLGAGGAGGDVSALLDSLLTTRIPNPVERAAAVNRLIAERGLPTRLGQASEFVDQTPQLVQNGSLQLVLLGVRHSVALGLFSRSARELTRQGELSLGLSPSDFRQQGGNLLFSRRLTPTMTLGLSAERTVTEGLAAQAGDYLRDYRLRTDLSKSISPRTQVTVSLGRQILKYNRSGTATETRAQVGLVQNF
jgi:uncharacterized protein (PEP-CTERM system associated)